MIFVLSPTCGIRLQSFFMEAKIRAFPAAVRRGEESGCKLFVCFEVLMGRRLSGF